MQKSHSGVRSAPVLYRPGRIWEEGREVLQGLDRSAVLGCFAAIHADVARGVGRRGLRLAKSMVFVTARASRVIYGVATNPAGTLDDTKKSMRDAVKRVPTGCATVVASGALSVPSVFGGAIGFLIGSGGLDGNGGLPDLDLAAGIGNHRSIFTHSVLMGATAEAVLIGLDKLALLTYQRLPEDHDPVWDGIYDFTARTLHAAKIGTSAGIAFHLAVDGALQPAALKHLPFSAPMEVHQGILVGNAASELGGASSVRRSEPQYLSNNKNELS